MNFYSNKPFASGKHLQAARIAAGLSQAELASLAGLHRNSLQRWESMDRIGRWSHALDQIEAALKSKGVTVSRHPATVTIAEHA